MALTSKDTEVKEGFGYSIGLEPHEIPGYVILSVQTSELSFSTQIDYQKAQDIISFLQNTLTAIKKRHSQ